MAGEIARFDAVYIPNVESETLTPELIVDESRTASGKMQRDAVAVKRRWKITASHLTPEETSAILDLLTAKMFGAVAFWLDEFGPESATVQAYVTVDNRERIAFSKDGTWYTNGSKLELTVVEQ